MNQSKNYLFVLLLIAGFCNALIADCPHCFTIAQVELTFLDHSTYKGYIKFYGWYEENNNGVKPLPGENILPLIDERRFPISIADTIYKVKDLPFFTNEDLLHDFKKDSIYKIVLNNWTEFKGAGVFQILSAEKCDFLLNQENHYYITRENETSEDFFVISNLQLTELELKIIQDNDLFFRKPDIQQYFRTKGIRLYNFNGTADQICSALDAYNGLLDKKIEEISTIKVSSDFDNYYEKFRDQLIFNREYYQLMKLMLESGNKDEFRNFVLMSKEISKRTKEKIYRKISEANSSNDILDLAVNLIYRIGNLPMDRNIQKDFDELLKKHCIKITLTYD